MRDYDPTTGRSLQADPRGWVDGASVYGYAGQNPAMNADPRGECFGPLIALAPACVGAVVGVVAGWLADRYFGDACYTWSEFLSDAALGAAYGAVGGVYGYGAKVGGAAGGVTDDVARFMDDLLRAGSAADRNGLSAAGRALQKHGNRPGSAFPPTSGRASAINEAGQAELAKILGAKGSTFNAGYSSRYGNYVDVLTPSGKGARFSSSGDFIGYLEP